MSFRTAGQSSFLAAAVAFGGVLGVGCSDGDGSNTGGSGGSGGSGGDPITGNGGSGGMAGAGGTQGGAGGNTGGVGGNTGGTGGGAGGNTGGTGGGGMGGDGGGGTGVPSGDGCDDLSKLEGTWAMKSVQPVTWEASEDGIILPGSGSFTVINLETVTQTGETTFESSAKVCALNIPAFRGEVESLGYVTTLDAYFPSEMVFDDSTAPAITATATVEGDHMTLEPMSMALGIEFDDPLNDAFPPSHSDAANVAVDHDQDGNPGITATNAPEVDPDNCPFDGPPPDNTPGDCTSPFAVTGAGSVGPQANELYLAQRTIFSMEGDIETCESGTGTLTTQSIESAIVDCNVMASTDVTTNQDRACNSDEKIFLNEHTPAYVPDGNGTIARLKLAGDATCADARAKFNE